MTDLTFCYTHMTRHDLEILDTIGTAEYLKGELSDDDIDVPPHMKPPNPEDSEVLPSHVHPSYPYGNPLNMKHPAAKPRRPWDPSSRALFEDMSYAGGGINGSMRWKDLALDLLLPIDQEREEAEKAAQARKLASGATSNHPPVSAPTTQPQTIDEDDENDENENDDDDEDEDEDADTSFEGDED